MCAVFSDNEGAGVAVWGCSYVPIHLIWASGELTSILVKFISDLIIFKKNKK